MIHHDGLFCSLAILLKSLHRVFLIGVYMTLKLKCFFCDSEDFGPAWETLTQDHACQDSIFSICFMNQTLPGRQTTEVIDLIRSCKQNCACSDDEGWCLTAECGHQLRCCWGQAYCEEE